MTEVLSKEQITANIETWCQALESGGYAQVEGNLHIVGPDEGFCCLGVACKVMGLQATQHEDLNIVSYDGEADVAPSSLQKMLGLTSSSGDYIVLIGDEGEEESSSLVDNNDKDAMNFIQIADIIRSRPKGLFIEGV